MSKKNYSNYSKPQVDRPTEVEENVEVAVTGEDLTEAIEEKVEEVVEKPVEAPVKKIEKGVVANCKKLNVRKTPSSNAQIVTVIKAGTKVTIDEKKSTVKYYKVIGAGFEGFCVKQFIEV